MIINIIIFTISYIISVQSAPQVLSARAYIFQAVAGGNPNKIVGIIDFTQSGRFLKLNGTVSGLPEGQHGFHIHEKGDIGNGCLSAGAHFNPFKLSHGAPNDSNRHLGDLGNVISPASGDTVISVSDSLATLSGAHPIIGRAVVIHEKVDDLGRGMSDLSKTTGNAGSRLACGVIGIVDEIDVFPTESPLPSTPSTQPLTSSTLSYSISFIIIPLLLLLFHLTLLV